MKPDLSVNIAGIDMRNPVIAASGTFGYGDEYSQFCRASELGAVVSKTVTVKPREGNPPPRLVETACGLLNAIGLDNIGVKAFVEEKLPMMCGLGTRIIVSAGGSGREEFIDVVDFLGDCRGIAGIELNFSCPNVDKRPVAQDAVSTGSLLKDIRRRVSLPLFAKLSPQVTDIVKIARVCEAEGVDAISLVNSFPGMAIDIETRRAGLGNITGGLSGPAVKPMALKMVWDVCSNVKIPVVGIGGIMNAADALEFMMAGATGVAIGTAFFTNPCAGKEIVDGLGNYLKDNGLECIGDIVGVLNGK